MTAGLAALVTVTSLATASAHATEVAGGRILAVNINCTGGVLKVERSEDQPSGKVRITTITPASCTSATHPDVASASGSGFGSFTGDCAEVLGTLTGTIRFRDASGATLYTSQAEGTFTAVRTSGGGVTATVAGATVTGDLAGTGAGAARSVAGTQVDCLTGTGPQSITMNADGSLTG